MADLPLGIRLTGFVAWVAWLFLHLLYLVGFRNRLSVLLSWGWSYITWDRGPRLVIESAESAEPEGGGERSGGETGTGGGGQPAP